MSDQIIPISILEVTIDHLAEMNQPPPFQRQGVFRFKELPAELRRRVYYFAVIEPHPLPLIPRHVNIFVKIYVLEKDMRMTNANKEFRELVKEFLYSENSFSFSVRPAEPREGAQQFQVDVRQIQKWYISVKKPDYYDFIDDGLEFQNVVPTLVFEGHEMKYLLVECELQKCERLAQNLGPLSMLRRLRLVHFRSSQAQMYHYFRFLEGLMMSDRPVPFSDYRDFWRKFISTGEDDLLRQPDKSWLVKNLDMTNAVVEKSKKQMEATAKELYSILGIEREFIPQD